MDSAFRYTLNYQMPKEPIYTSCRRNFKPRLDSRYVGLDLVDWFLTIFQRVHVDLKLGALHLLHQPSFTDVGYSIVSNQYVSTNVYMTRY